MSIQASEVPASSQSLTNRIVIIDDHPSTRDGLSIRISLEPDLEVCGEADDVGSGMALIEKESPDIAIIDVALKTGNGIELIKRVRDHSQNIKILVWSMYDESLYAERALRAGAHGYINKEHVSDSIVHAIRNILKGNTHVSPEMSIKMLSRRVCGKTNLPESPISRLSDRELETFNLIGRGLNTNEIAERLELSPRTVETYRARIKEKMGVRGLSELTMEATRWVIENG